MLTTVNNFPDFKTRLIYLQKTKGQHIYGFSKPRNQSAEDQEG